MGDPFGIASSSIGIAAAFATCVEVFECVQVSRRFGKDYQTGQLRLTLARLRLSRWGEAVGVHFDPQLGNPSASSAKLQAAKDAIMQILVLFADSNRVAVKFKLRGGNDSPPPIESGMDIATLSINNKMSDLAKRRQRSPGLLKVSSWAIDQSSTLENLIDDVVELISELEQLFPPEPAIQAKLLKEESFEVQGEDQKQAIARSSEGVDDLLSKEIGSALGHQYRNIKVEAGEDGSAITGDIYSDDYTGGQPSATSHMYDGIQITGTKGLRVLHGNKYGGDDFFSRSSK